MTSGRVFRMTRRELDGACAVRPPGFCAEIRTLGTFEGDMFEVDRVHWFAITRKHVTRSAPTAPTISEMLINFSGAMARWFGSGLALATREQWAERMRICGGCQHWSPEARAGLGHCTAPGCGCTKLKHWLATEKCPLGKWDAL